MQKTFKAIRHGDIETVKKILETNPEEIHAISKQPPKKDDGQSLLQVALKTGNLDIANLLLDYNANVNFMESAECCNEWRVPVLHDAIRCAIMCSRWNIKIYGSNNFETRSTKEKADAAYDVLRRMLTLGADITAKDSVGNTVLDRAISDARQLLPAYNYADKSISNDRILTEELRYDFTRIFHLLFEFGADNQWIDRNSGKTLKEYYSEEPVADFLSPHRVSDKKKSIISRLFKNRS